MVAGQDNLTLTIEFKPGQIVRFSYLNWQGITANRTARVIGLTFGKTKWHPDPQWLLRAVDLEKNELRLFAVRDMIPL